MQSLKISNKSIVRKMHAEDECLCFYIFISSLRISCSAFWSYSPFIPQLFQDPSLLFYVFIKFNSCCPSILGCVVFHWTMINLWAATLREDWSLFSQKQRTANSSQLGLQSCWDLAWLELAWSYAYCCNCYELVCLAATLFQKILFPCSYPPTLAPVFFLCPPPIHNGHWVLRGRGTIHVFHLGLSFNQDVEL